MKRVFKQTSRTGRVRVWTIEVDGRYVRTTYGEEGGKFQEVVDEGQPKNVGRANEVTPEQDAEYLAGRAVLQKTRDGYAEEGTESATGIDWNSSLPINLRFYKPDNSLSSALLRKLQGGEAWLGRKRDGEMTVVVKGPDGVVDIYSRRMLRHHHLEEGMFTWRDRFPDLVREIEERDDIPPCSILLGDVVASREDDGRWEVASFMKSLTPETEGKAPLFYYCWDIAFWDGTDLLTGTSVSQRYGLVWDVFGHEPTGDSLVVPVEVWEVGQLCRMCGLPDGDVVEVAQGAAKKWGWEGWVVVNPDGVYGDKAYNFRGKTDRPGRFCGKLKPSYEDDFVAFFDPDNTKGGGAQGEWGSGNSRGRVGSVSLYQYSTSGKLIYVCKCGGGITDDFRAKYSDPSVYPLVLQVEYTERTYRSEGDKTDALTYPRVVCVRDDKELTECINPRL